VRYVREAGGGRLFAANINNIFGLYRLDSYGHMIEVDDYRSNTVAAKKLRNALRHCDEEYFPAGTYFLDAPVKQAGNGAAPGHKASLE